MNVVLRRCAKNALLAVPGLGQALFGRNPLGVEADAELLQASLDLYRSRTSFAGKRVLELGPGRSLETLKTARAEGATLAAAADVSPLIDAEAAAAAGVDYRVYPGEVLPFDDGSFDLVISHDVFEHLRAPAETVGEVRRVLADGGELVCTIDLRDHFHIHSGEARWNDFLRFSDITWWLMTSNRGAYTNRLRRSDWQRIFDGAGFARLETVAQESDVLAALPRPARVQGMSADDFATWRIDVHAFR